MTSNTASVTAARVISAACITSATAASFSTSARIADEDPTQLDVRVGASRSVRLGVHWRELWR